MLLLKFCMIENILKKTRATPIVPFFGLLLILTTSVYAQPCPPTINEWSEKINTSYFEPFPCCDIWGYVEYRTREFGGKIEIKVNWSSLHNGYRYGLTDEEFKQIMYKAIIVDFTGKYCEHLQGQKQFVFFEETECTQRRYCYLHLVNGQEVFCCDDGWTGPPPEFYTYQNEKYLKLFSVVTCGTQCCEYIYKVECAQKPQGGGNYAHIISFTKNSYPGSSCPESQETDCLTGEPEPCESTCQ